MAKKLLSAILSILLVVSVFGTTSALANDETEILGPGVENNTLPEVSEGYNRYFFYLPKSWQNEYTQTAGIYWFEGTDAHDSLPGVEAIKADAEGVYYYDVPKDVDGIMWNNFFDGGNDRTTEEYYASKITDGAYMYPYEPGEHELYPDGIYDYNNMIFIVDFSRCGCLHWDYRAYGGDWYYYYGNGEYGTTPERGEVVYTDRSIGEYCPHQQPETPDNDKFGLPEIAEGYNRYFFYMPDSWRNEYSDTAGIYWWEGTGAQVAWPGLEAHKADAENIYYYDVPKDVKQIIWNNYIHFSPDQVVGPEYAATCKTEEISLNNGVYNGMIFVVTIGLPLEYGMGSLYGGEWRDYFGGGEFSDYNKRFYIVGNVYYDYEVNIKDATHIQKFIAGLDVPTVGIHEGDVDNSGEITVRDATAIQKYIADIDTGYPIGEYRTYNS